MIEELVRFTVRAPPHREQFVDGYRERKASGIEAGAVPDHSAITVARS